MRNSSAVGAAAGGGGGEEDAAAGAEPRRRQGRRRPHVGGQGLGRRAHLGADGHRQDPGETPNEILSIALPKVTGILHPNNMLRGNFPHFSALFYNNLQVGHS